MKGTVKWFNSKKGYGFIVDEDTGSDIFVHYSGIVGHGFKTLEEGQQVDFHLDTNQKGKLAVNVKVIEP